MGSKECVMYGYLGGDEFSLKIGYNNSAIRDFKDYNDEDKLYISGINPMDISCYGTGEYADTSLIQGGGNSESPACTGSGNNTNIHIEKFIQGSDLIPGKTETAIITLEGENVGKVGGWMKKAKNEDGLLSDSDLKKLPIYIQK
jgi:hypothetical protein